jgi:penicillin-binding protein 2
LHSYLKALDSDWYNQRLTGIVYSIFIAFAILFSRLFYLQIISGQEFRRLSDNNCIRLQGIEFSRGLIFDRNEALLVDNRPSFDLGIILKDADPVDLTIKKLSEYIKIPAADLLATIENNKGPYYKQIVLKEDIGRDALAVVEAHKYDLPGIVIDVKQKRHYINSNHAAHLTGYIGEISSDELKSGKFPGYRGGDYVGKIGMEKACETFLIGKRGGKQVEVNATGQVVRILKTVDATPGYNIYLSIDSILQQKTEDLLKGMAGAVAAMDPETGHILALASSPSFDQNIFVCGMTSKQWRSLVSDPLRPLENKVVHGEYPPASIYKIVTAIAGMEEKIIDEKTTVVCPGYYSYGDRDFRCWKETGHGKVNVVDALAESCDVFFYKVGQEVGIERLSWYARACGLGSITGVNLDNESRGLVPTSAWKKRRMGESWHRGETLLIAIGQGYNLVTPIQMLVLTSAIANGGFIYRPLIVKKIETAEGHIVTENKAEIMGKLPISDTTLKIVRQGMWNVVNHARGTARGVRLAGIDICGKTGTAQVVSRKKDSDAKRDNGPDSLKPHAWFIAFAPADNPRIAVVVFVENGGSGSGTAAPIASTIIQTYLLNSSHQETGSDLN